MRNMFHKIILFLLLAVAAGAATPADAVLEASGTETAAGVSTTSAAAGICQEGAPTGCSSTPSWQQELNNAQSAWGVCQDDVNRFCEGIQVGDGRIEKCLKDHRKKLSKKCRAMQKFK